MGKRITSNTCYTFGYCYARKTGTTVIDGGRDGINDYNELKALTGDVQSINYLLGQQFSSIKEMCAAYGVSVATYSYRLSQGWPLEEALTGTRKSKACIDHLGKEYRTQKEMCNAYGVKPDVFRWRLKKGMSVAQALGCASDEKSSGAINNAVLNNSPLSANQSHQESTIIERKKIGEFIQEEFFNINNIISILSKGIFSTALVNPLKSLP